MYDYLVNDHHTAREVLIDLARSAEQWQADGILRLRSSTGIANRNVFTTKNLREVLPASMTLQMSGLFNRQ